MTKQVSFCGIYKFNTSFDKVQTTSSYINNQFSKHPKGYRVEGSDEFVFSGINSINQVSPVCYDSDNENYILTDEHAKEEGKYYTEMLDEWDYYHAYYGADELTTISCEIATDRYREKVKNIVDKAKKEGTIKELTLKIDVKNYNPDKAPKFLRIV